jgi:hypothetical protein
MTDGHFVVPMHTCSGRARTLTFEPTRQGKCTGELVVSPLRPTTQNYSRHTCARRGWGERVGCRYGKSQQPTWERN